MKKKASVFMLFTIGLVIFNSCNRDSGERPASAKEYHTMEVVKQNTILHKTYPATVKGQEDIEIRPRVDGFIEEIYIDEGSVVCKGQPLFRIDSPQSEKEYISAKAQVESAKATVNTALLDVERVRPLSEKGIMSDVQLKSAQNAYESALASLAQAEATLRNAAATLSWANITSPVDGIIGTIPYRQGSLVNSQNVLTTVANTGSVYAYFSINEKDLMAMCSRVGGTTQAGIIENMPKVTLLLSNGDEYTEKGTIETIAGVVNTTTGSVNLRASFPNSNNFLRSGISGKIILPFEIEDVYIIPQEATFALQDKVMVYTVQSDTVRSKAISVLALSDGLHFAVTDGLCERQTIVAGGVATLSDGAVINITPKTLSHVQ